MSCKDLHDWMDELLEGSLPEERAEALEAHVASCPSCQEAVGTALRLRELAGTLPRSVEPPRDLWPAIRARIAGEGATQGLPAPVSRVHRFGLLAAAALVVVGAGIVALLLVNGAATRTATNAGGTAGLLPASLEEVAMGDAEADLRQASQALRAALTARRDSLAPETRRVVEENLQVIDDALGRVRAALQRDPGNRQLTTLLVATYKQQIDLLQRATQLPGQA